MGIETIECKGQVVPKFQSEGFAARFIFGFAQEVLSGKGLDVGCMHKEWAFPGAQPIDITFNEKDEEGKLIEASNLPKGEYDYIFSSNTLEHCKENWTDVLDHWCERLTPNGNIFLYLPSYESRYWRPWANKKHIHILTPQILKDYLEDRGWRNIFTSGHDLNYCFSVMATKPASINAYGIYKFTSKATGKFYIGGTSTSFKDRFKKHWQDLKNGLHFCDCLQEDYDLYGRENFTIELLENCQGLNRQEVEERETEHIAYYKKASPEYILNVKDKANITKAEVYKKLLLYTKDGELLGEFGCTRDVAHFLNIPKENIQTCQYIQEKGKAYLIHERWVVVPEGIEPKLGNNYTIHEINDNGEVINVFWKAQEAADSLNCSRRKINTLLTTNRATVRNTRLILPFGESGKKRNFINGNANLGKFKTQDCKDKIKNTHAARYKNSTNNGIKLVKTDLKGNLICKFASLGQAAKTLSISPSTLGLLIRNKGEFSNENFKIFKDNEGEK